jgi:tetratricopeptide (TPR) repeat protein
MKVISIFVVISLLALTIPFKDDILRTLRITETVSQERSTSGRIEAGNVTKKIIAKIPLMGVGNGNFSLAANEFLHENDNNTYSNFGGNSLFQLIAEKGIIGLLMWMGILTQIIYLFVKEKDKSPTAYMIVVIFFVILIRELSFPVFFEYEGLQLTFFTLLAIFQNQTVDKSCDMPIFNFKRLSIISWIPVAIFTILLFLLFIHYKNEKNNNLFLVALKRGDLNNALTYIDRTKESTPYLINRSICHWELFKKNKDPRSLLSSKLNLQKAIEKNPYDMMLLHNLSVVLNEEGKKDSSLFILSELVTRFPNNALYQMTMFDSFYRNGNKKEAQMHILKAVQNSPGILETPLWQNLTRKDTLFTQKIIQTLKINDPELNAEPIMLAKYGKLLLNLGDTIRAKEYLTRSVSILPNLSRPWCYLGIIAYQQGDTINMKRYIKLSMLLDKEDSVPQFYSSILEGKKIDKIPYYTDCHFIHGKYLLKFRQWYQSNTLPEVGYITY